MQFAVMGVTIVDRALILRMIGPMVALSTLGDRDALEVVGEEGASPAWVSG
ncbi:MAG TPA: hypothetical protein VMA77_17610 [Solirubrobacteraceae bacterium]|nr:hypothetical protein [Solirubrobacteraceae bacterium]